MSGVEVIKTRPFSLLGVTFPWPLSQSESEPSGNEGHEGGGGGGGCVSREEYPCGGCGKDVQDHHEAIYCESGCERWYHRECTGMSKVAYDLLTGEDSAEWVCDTCISNKTIPNIKMASKSS